MRICVAVDGSKPSLDAVNLLIDHADWYREKPTVELVTVHVKHAKSTRCDLICIGTRGMSALGKALVGSTATKVLHISDLPVLLVK